MYIIEIKKALQMLAKFCLLPLPPLPKNTEMMSLHGPHADIYENGHVAVYAIKCLININQEQIF